MNGMRVRVIVKGVAAGGAMILGEFSHVNAGQAMYFQHTDTPIAEERPQEVVTEIRAAISGNRHPGFADRRFFQ
jgi:hypothetical protein